MTIDRIIENLVLSVWLVFLFQKSVKDQILNMYSSKMTIISTMFELETFHSCVVFWSIPIMDHIIWAFCPWNIDANKKNINASRLIFEIQINTSIVFA